MQQPTRTDRSGRDLYATLGVAPTATDAEITAAFRTRAKELHPDRHPGDAAVAECFKVLTQAYDVLTRPDQRAAYDARRSTSVTPAAPSARTTRHEPVFRTTGRARVAKWCGVVTLVVGVAGGVLLAGADTGDGAKTFTLWFVVVKLVVCGAILWGAGAWRLQRLLTDHQSGVTGR